MARPEAEVEVNGICRPLAAPVLAPLLAALGYLPERPGLAVAVNGQVVPRRAWATHPIAAGDRIEVVGAVQGG